MNEKDLDLFAMATKFPRLNEFCRKHNINRKIIEKFEKNNIFLI